MGVSIVLRRLLDEHYFASHLRCHYGNDQRDPQMAGLFLIRCECGSEQDDSTNRIAQCRKDIVFSVVYMLSWTPSSSFLLHLALRRRERRAVDMLWWSYARSQVLVFPLAILAETDLNIVRGSAQADLIPLAA